MAITQEKNIEMLEKLADGNFKIKYPKTRDTQVIGLETAQKILDKIKTVDGAGSGLDADLLDGKHSSDFQSSVKTYGTVTYSDSIASGGMLTKNIPIGSGKQNAIISIKSSSRGALIFCGTDKTKTYAIAQGPSSYVSSNSRQYSDKVLISGQFGANVAGNYIEIADIYISGSNLVILFNNAGTQSWNLSCTISWEVW